MRVAGASDLTGSPHDVISRSLFGNAVAIRDGVVVAEDLPAPFPQEIQRANTLPELAWLHLLASATSRPCRRESRDVSR